MDIEGLGEETIDLLFSRKLIRNFSDLYDLKKEDILPLERFAEKSASNIIKGIEQSKEVPYQRVLYALGIRHVGETVAKTIAKRFRSIDDLMNADMEQITSVREIGPKIAASIIAYFSDTENREIIQKLKEKGLRLSDTSEAVSSGSALQGKTIVISGTFEKYSRDEYKQKIENNGGKNSSSISGNTSFVLAGEGMGPAKKEKADSLGIPLINENEFLKIIGEE